MAACIPYAQWLTANAACKAKSSTFAVRGFGYVPTGMAGLRSLGFSITGSITPASVATAMQTGQMVQTAPAAGGQPAVVAAASAGPSINTAPVYSDPNDPCYIASQTPCPAGQGCPAVCPPGYHSIGLLTAPGKPSLCNCAKDKPASGSGGSATAPAMDPGGGIVQSTAAGGFSHWGLLAALAAGGGVLYLVMKKKGSS